MRILGIVFILITLLFAISKFDSFFYSGPEYSENYKKAEQKYWFVLYRDTNTEYLYRGVPGDAAKSDVVRIFKVKVGTRGQSPTPLPTLAGRNYWTVIDKYSSAENPETAPYFIELDVPGGDAEPFGPVPYEECNGQCYWNLPGAFGLHGVNGDLSRLSDENAGSSGCIRHTDEDIVFLYELLDLKEEIRYYVTEKRIDYPLSRILDTSAMRPSIPLSSLALTKTGE